MAGIRIKHLSQPLRLHVNGEWVHTCMCMLACSIRMLKTTEQYTTEYTYHKLENICVANFHVINFCVKKFSYKQTGNKKILTPKFTTRAHGSSSRFLDRHGRVRKSLLHPKLPWIWSTDRTSYQGLCPWQPSPPPSLQGDHLRWQTCWQWSFRIRKTALRLEVASNWHHEWR